MIGFCLVEQADVAVDANRRCLADGSLALPPSFGSKEQQWVDGAWVPELSPKPGHTMRGVKTQTTIDEARARGRAVKLEQQRAAYDPLRICKHCQKQFLEYDSRIRRLYCTPICKAHAQVVAHRARRHVEVVS